MNSILHYYEINITHENFTYSHCKVYQMTRIISIRKSCF